MIERWLTGIHSRLRRLPPVETSEAATPRRIPARRRTSSEAARSAGSRARRLAQYEEVKQRFGAGETVLAISRAMALSRDLVRRYAYAESFPEQSARVPGPSVLDPYSDYLEARVAGGCENAMTLWRDLKELGYTGSAKPVRRWLRHRRTTAASSSLHQDLCGFPAASATATIEMPAPLLSARKLAPLLMQSPEALDASASATLARIAQDRDVAGVLALALQLQRWGSLPVDLDFGEGAMSGVAIEDLLELWSAELRKAKAKLGWLIGHPSVVASAAAFLDTLLGPERRKTGWMRAEAAGDAGPWRQQAVLGRSHWDADALRDVVRDYALETLAEGDAVLVIDETGFLKQGTASCGVARQYTGTAGKITNCQVGVFAAYVSTKGHAFIDRQLYLPKAWTDNPERLAACRT